MAKNPHQPREYDAILGGLNSSPMNAAVLGGIDGVKQRLAHPEVKIRVAALTEALKYGRAGLGLLMGALQDDAKEVQSMAFSLLTQRTELKVKHHLMKFLPYFEFETIAVNKFGEEIQRRREIARYFTEDLGNGVFLEMVSIPAGTSPIGSPETEKGRTDNENFHRQIAVSSFFMSKYPVTQAQWEAVVALPQVYISLEPNPSRFKGANHPVEEVSWYDAREFCARLSQKTGREYGLPSSVQWEYACRAGTTTPFHFGETITSALANYNGKHTYACESEGVFRNQTTPVGSFPPNAFGLYDMHGNVCEWCSSFYRTLTGDEFWHGGVPSYEHLKPFGVDLSWSGACCREFRGGSWQHFAQGCRSAAWDYELELEKHYFYEYSIGFRVECSVIWTPIRKGRSSSKAIQKLKSKK